MISPIAKDFIDYWMTISISRVAPKTRKFPRFFSSKLITDLFPDLAYFSKRQLLLLSDFTDFRTQLISTLNL